MSVQPVARVLYQVKLLLRGIGLLAALVLPAMTPPGLTLKRLNLNPALHTTEGTEHTEL